VTFPISRQGLEQIALALIVGALLFGILAFFARRRGGSWRRFAVSSGVLAALVLVCYGLAYTIAPNIPTPPVPFTARFAQNPTPDTQATVAAGRETFQRTCAVCHGARGLGDGPAAFTLVPRPVNLQLHVPQHAPGEIYYWISEGIAGTPMAAWKATLTDDERWAVVRYLQALAAGRAN
jgi:mono/diheme cytochrome c family protein